MVKTAAVTRADNVTAAEKARDLLAARNRGDNVLTPPGWNDTLEVLLSHRSVRAYLPGPLPEGTIETLVAAAQSASSSSNLQCWSVVAVEDPARKARLAALASAQKYIVQAPLFLVWLVDLARLDGIAAARGVTPEALSCLEAFTFGAVDCALAAQNAVIAAESLGLGCVYIGAIRNHPVEVATELALPPNVFALVGLVVGHPDSKVTTGIKPRLPQDAVLLREQYSSGPAQRAAIESYNNTMRAFQAEQGMKLQDWTEQAVNRVKDVPGHDGRARLREALQALGFGLR
jgi:nitroreductase